MADSGKPRNPNTKLTQARCRLLSPSGSGRELSRQELADAVNIYVWNTYQQVENLTATYIGDLELGRHRWPGTHRREAFRHILGAATDSELGFYINRSQPDTVEVKQPATLRSSNVEPNAEGGMHRRELLGGLLAVASGSVTTGFESVSGARRIVDAALEGPSVGRATIERWQRAAFEHACSYQQIPPTRLLEDVIADLGEVQVLLAQDRSRQVQRELTHVTAELAALAGIFLSALGRHREARAWFHTTRLAADRADDAALMGLGLARSATVSLYYGSPQVALELGQEAVATLGSKPSPSLVRALLVQARALARLQDPAGARRHLDAARVMFDRLPTSERAETAMGFTERQFLMAVGNTLTYLNEHDEAGQAQSQALALYRQTEYLDPTLIRLDQAAAMARATEYDACCEFASQTLAALPDPYRPGLVTHRGWQVHSELPAHARSRRPAVELRELLNAA